MLHPFIAMLIDTYMPRPDASERHAIVIAAPTATVYDALLRADLAEARIVKALLTLRLLPKLIARGEWRSLRFPSLRLVELRRAGFGVLAETRGREILLGVSGRFWRLVDNVAPFDERNFDGPVRTGTARAVWNFVVQESGEGHTLLSTETRIECGDAASRRAFRAYWLVVRPFSGLTRRVMLRAVRRAAAS